MIWTLHSNVCVGGAFKLIICCSNAFSKLIICCSNTFFNGFFKKAYYVWLKSMKNHDLLLFLIDLTLVFKGCGMVWKAKLFRWLFGISVIWPSYLHCHAKPTPPVNIQDDGHALHASFPRYEEYRERCRYMDIYSYVVYLS